MSQSKLSSGVDLANFEAVRFVRDLAQKQKSPALAQLASRMAQAIRAGGNSRDPFAKVKSLISNMIEKLLSEAQEDANEHAFCEKEMAETEAKKADNEANIEGFLNDLLCQVFNKTQDPKKQFSEYLFTGTTTLYS